MDDRLKPAAIYIQGLPTSIGNIQVEDICKKAGKIKKIKVYRDAVSYTHLTLPTKRIV